MAKRLAVQNGTTTITAGNTSVDVTLGTNISDLSKAFLVMKSSGDSGANLGSEHQATGYLWDDAGTTKIKFERDASTDDCQISYFVVEAKTGEFTVQRGSVQITAGNATNTDDFTTAITQSRTLLVSNSRSSNVTSEGFAIGEFSDNDTVLFTRNDTSNICTIRYEVVEWSADSEVNVYTGEQDLSGNIASGVSTDITSHGITKAQTWMFCTFRHATDGLEQTAICASLTSDTSILWQRYAQTTSYVSTGRYWLVEFPSDVVVSHSSVTEVASGDLTEDYTVSAIDETTAWGDHYNSCNGTGTAHPRGRFIDYFNSTTVLRCQRYYNGQAANMAFQVIDTDAWEGGVLISDSGVGSDSGSIYRGFESEVVTVESVSDVIDKLVQDTGGGTEILTLLASILVQDTGDAVDIISLLNELGVIVDTSEGTEIISIINFLTETDVVSGSEAVSILNILSEVVDSGSGLESLTILNILATLIDLASGAELIDILNTLATLTDSGVGVDLINIISELSLADTASGTEIIDILRIYAIQDVGAGIDIVSLLNFISASDTATASELIDILVAILIQDSGSGAGLIDVSNLGELVEVADLASGVDIISILNNLSIIDLGSAIELVTVFVENGIVDNSSGSDIVDILNDFVISDTAIHSEAIAILSLLTISEVGTASETLSILALITLLETAEGVDTALIVKFLSIIDTATASEILIITGEVLKTVSDTATSQEILSILNELNLTDSGLGAEEVEIIESLSREILDAGIGVDEVLKSLFDIYEKRCGIYTATDPYTKDCSKFTTKNPYEKLCNIYKTK